jgi:hypothetical protein
MNTRKTGVLNVEYFKEVFPNFTTKSFDTYYTDYCAGSTTCCGVCELTGIDERTPQQIAKDIAYAQYRKKGMLIYYGYPRELARLKKFGFKIERFYNPNSHGKIGRATLFLDQLDVKSLYKKRALPKVRK